MNTRLHESPHRGKTRVLLLLLALALVVAAGTFAAACGDEEETTTTGATTETTAAPSTETTAAPSTETTAAPVELPDTIKVGAVIPLTGKYSGLGEQVKNGYELAVKNINDAGGLDVGGTKVPIELIVLDDESDPSKTVQQLETQASNDVVAYLGGAGSDLHAAAAGIAEKNKIAVPRHRVRFVLGGARSGIQVPLLALPEIPGPRKDHLRDVGFPQSQTREGNHLRGDHGLGRGNGRVVDERSHHAWWL